MLANPFAELGLLLQWISSLLLVLLLYRLGRIGTHRRMLWIWAAAWGAGLVSLTGYTINTVATLAGRPFAVLQSLRWLDDVCYVPGTMLFMTLVGIGVAQAVGRRLPVRVERIAVLTSIVVGLLAMLLGDRALTGALLLAVTMVISLGALVRIIGSERRLWGRRLLLPVAIVLLGTVTVTFQLMRYFGSTLDPLGDFATSVQNLSGYAGALTCALLGAAVIVMITEDSVRAREFAQQERVRALAEIDAHLAAASINTAAAPPGDYRRTDERHQDESLRIDAVAVVVAARARPRAPADDAAPMRAPTLSSRTATLPQPVRQPDGSTSMALLIDDEAPVRSTLARIFQRGGWAVREAATGAEALSWLLGVDAREAPAVVLCDLRMPGVGGRELYAYLQEQRPEFLQRLIFATDRADEASAAEFIRATGCQLIRKPGSVEEVARAVERVLIQQ